MNYLRVKGWEHFQHYKDRSPPWIKLHRELLRDYDFSCLQDASKLHLMLIWLLASQLDNRIPADPDWIQKQIGIASKPNLKELIKVGFLIDDSNVLADCKQDAMLETETETEKETHLCDLQFDEWWDAYGKKVNRKKCEQKWRRMNWAKLGVTPADLISDAKARHTSRQWREGYQPHPLTYLNGERWNDEMEKEKIPRTQEAVQAYLDKHPDAVPKYLHAKHWTAAHDYLSGAIA